MKIAALLCIAAAIFGFWAGKSLTEGQVTKLKLEQANEQVSQYNESISRNSRHARNVSVARDKASRRNAATDSDIRGNSAELERLRNDAAASAQAAASDLNACTAHAAAVTEIFGACASELVEVAAEADRWVSHATLIQDTITSAETVFAAEQKSHPTAEKINSERAD